MKRSILLLLALASCAPTRPAHVSDPPQAPVKWSHTAPTRLTRADSTQMRWVRLIFDGHPPVVVMDLEAAPDSIATVVAQTLTDSIRKASKK